MLQYWRVFALVALLMAVGAFQLYGLFSNKGYMPAQPIAFSHVTHAGALKLECLYCHHQAEKGPYAGIPSVELCMGCHAHVQVGHPEVQKLAAYYESGEPIPWVRIHKLPDHAYFSHEWHIAAGVACQECHGPIQNMPVVEQWKKLEMADCMACHRQDTFVEQINHPPTYHESAPQLVSGSPMVDRGDDGDGSRYQSVRRHIETYYPDLSDEGSVERLQASLRDYVNDIYIHGRSAQLRNQNAHIECSTCHY